ncbi:MAG: TraR/DksA C4-type zinc finger protein [Patescibacteria group bacterium]|nr:TraR/DksA C4-type zinc finger protein [Patescibacteria group bacterium]MDE1966848.1 TraR/DksA C4-type zinc finger protein [Patescibacteria group bacterium]
MTEKDLEHFKQKLLADKARLEAGLADIGQKTDSADDWQPAAKDIEVDAADENEVADKLEEIEGNSGIVAQLENELKEVNAALDRMKSGKYGLCETCGKPIEKERLEANPSARVSIKHKHAA